MERFTEIELKTIKRKFDDEPLIPQLFNVYNRIRLKVDRMLKELKDEKRQLKYLFILESLQ